MEYSSSNRIEMISVVVPVYNAEKYIGECIESILRQSYEDWELILVNDGSSDGSADVISGYLSDSRIRYFNKINSGVTETRWKGIENAKGDIVMFLDADDLLVSEALDFVSKNFSDDIDIVSFEMQSIRTKDNLQPYDNISEHGEVLSERMKIAENILLGKMLSCVCGGGYRLSAIRDCRDIFCNGLRIAEDTMFNLELALRKPLRVQKTSAKIYGYRVNESSVTRAVNTRRFDAVNDAIAYLESFAAENRSDVERLMPGIAFRILLLWSTFMFNPSNKYYRNKDMRGRLKKMYARAFSHLYPYLRVYLFADLFIGPWLSQKLINRR